MKKRTKALVLAGLLLAAVSLWAQHVIKVTGADAVANTVLGYFAATSDGSGVLLATAPHGFNGTTWDRVRVDPCQASAKITVVINQTANTQLVTGTASKKIYICSILIDPVATATNISLVEGTGSTCGTGTVGVLGGSGTAATGPNIAANGGFAFGNGAAFIAAEATNADNLCLLQSAANQISGVLTYVVV